MLRAFSLPGRVTTRTVPYAKLKRLREIGVAERIRQGVYAITPEYMDAFRALRVTDAMWQRTMTLPPDEEPALTEFSEAAE